MIDNSKEYILCAAVLRKSPRPETSYHEGQNDIHRIEIGYRHHDIYQRFNNRDEYSDYKDCPLLNLNNAQGFYTSKGRYVDRYEAMKIAYECGQMTDPKLVFKSKERNDLNFISEVKSSSEDGALLNKELSKIYRPLFSEDLY